MGLGIILCFTRVVQLGFSVFAPTFWTEEHIISSEIFNTNIKNNSSNRWIDETSETIYEPGFQDLTFSCSLCCCMSSFAFLGVFIFFLEFSFTIAQAISMSHLIVRFGCWSSDCLFHWGAHEKSPSFIVGKDRTKIGHGHHLLSLSAILFLSFCLALSICSFMSSFSSLLSLH